MLRLSCKYFTEKLTLNLYIPGIYWYFCSILYIYIYIYIKNEKTLKKEQRSKDAAAKKS